MRCPFHPPCEADLEPMIVHTGPEAHEFFRAYPQHQVVGDSSWFGQCPGSHIMIFDDGHYTETAMRVLEEASIAYNQHVLRRVAEFRALQAAREMSVEELQRRIMHVESDDPNVEIFRFGDTSDRPAPPNVEDFFPGRPADAPEPGPGEAPTALPPMDIGGGHLGRAGMDNARDQLRGMISMTISAIDRAQAHVARIIASVEMIEGLAVTCETQADAALSLARASVGSDNIPEEAQRMLAELTNAHRYATDSADGLLPALALLRGRLDTLQGTYTAAREAATEYMARP